MVDAWLAGLLGGLVGTVAMTALMMPMMRGQPSGPAMLLARITGKDPSDKVLMMPAMVMHFGYGTFWGVVLALAATELGWAVDLLWAYGLGLGVFLLMVLMAVWAPILRMRPPPGTRAKMMVGMVLTHLVYGGVTGIVAQLLL